MWLSSSGVQRCSLRWFNPEIRVTFPGIYSITCNFGPSAHVSVPQQSFAPEFERSAWRFSPSALPNVQGQEASREILPQTHKAQEPAKINTCLLKWLFVIVPMQTFPPAVFSTELNAAGSAQVSAPPGRCFCRILLSGRRKLKGFFVHNIRILLLSCAFRHIFKWQELSVFLLSEFILLVAAFK